MGKSTGQIIGTVVGGVIGAFVGYPMLGASLGGMLGGIVDPPKGPDIKGPRLNDLSVQSSSYGQVIPRVYGTVALAGNVFWIENNALAEHEKTEEQGGKGGGGGATTTSYWYSSTFALGLCEGPIAGIRRIWVSGKLIYDAGSNDLNTIIASNMQMMVDRLFASSLSLKGTDVQATADASPTWTLYYGDNTQTANPRMEATLGVGNVPGYRGLAYIVFEDFDLTNYGNSLMGAQFKVEVVKALSLDANDAKQCEFAGDSTGVQRFGQHVKIMPDRVTYSRINADSWDSDLIEIGQQDFVLGSSLPFSAYPVALDPYHDSTFESKLPLEIMSSDTDFLGVMLYRNPSTRIIGFSAVGEVIMDTGPMPAGVFPYDGYYCAIRGSEMYMVTSNPGTYLYKIPISAVFSTYFGPSVISPTTYTSSQIGISENYVFTVDYVATSPTSCTVRRINRGDLTLNATWTQPVSGSYAMLYVESDDVVYTMSNQSGLDALYMWVNGVATDTGIRYSGDNYSTNRLVFASPLLAYIFTTPSGPPELWACWRSVTPEQVQLSSIVEAECLKAGLLTASDLDVTALTQEVRGYRVTQVAAIRAGLEPLQGAWPFDVIQNGYKIKFIPRGGSSVGTVTKEELGAAAPGDNDVISVTESREMDAQLARKAVITFLDVNREYDVSEQSAERLNTDAVNIRSIEMPIVLTPDEGAQIVERLLYLWWLERRDLTFTLPPTWLHLEPADVVTIQSANATFEARLTSCQYLPDGRVEVEAKYNDAPVYVSTAVGAEPPYTGQTLAYGGPTDLWLLDVPCMSSEMDGPGFLAAVNGYTPGWAGATMVRSEDGGESWISTQGFGTPGSVAGNVTTTLGDGRTDIIDTKNAVTFAVRKEIPTSVTFAAFAAGSNHFAIGADGRWEIVGALTATDNDDGTVTLSNLVRGRFGTEHNTANHTGTDYVVGLDRALVRWIGMDLGAINLQRMYRGVTKGYSVDSATTQTFAWTGESQRPLSPVYLNGDRDKSTNDWHLTWIPRSRTATEPFSGVSSPVGESTEQYKAEIWSTNHAALLRTISGLTSAACDYTAAQQVTDFGLRQLILYVKVYQWSPSVGWGWPLVTSITRHARDNADFYDDTILALSPVTYYKFDGNSTTVTDSSTNANTGTAASSGITYQQSPLLLATGYSFLCAPGTGAGYIICPRLAAMDDAFTVVFLVKPTSLSATFTILQKGNVTTSGQQGYYCNLTTAGKISFTWYNTQWRTVTTTNAVLQANEMAHIAFNYSGSGTLKFNIYKNGALFESLTLSHAIVNITESVTIAAARNGSTYSNGLTGYIDDWAWFQGSLTANQIKSLYEES